MKKKFLQGIPLALGAVLLVILGAPTPASLILGGLCVLLGEGIRVWAGGHLNRNKEITMSGPYAYVRDPLYLGRFFLLVGFCVMAWGYNWITLILGLSVFFLNYMPRKHRKETARLENLFGEAYVKYASHTRSLIPRLRPYPGAAKRPWRFDLFWNENREQYLLLGVLVLSLLIISRYLFA